MDIKLIKRRAKNALNSNYLNALGFILIVFLIILVVQGIGSLIPIVNILIAIFISSFVEIANCNFYKKFLDTNSPVKYMDCLPDPITSLKYFCVNFLFSLISILIFIIPIFFIFSLDFFFIGIIWAILFGIGILIFLAPAISLAPYFLIENKEMSIIDVLSSTLKIYKNNFKSFVWLFISFIPWFLLIIVTFGLAAFYVAPYFSLSIYSAYKSATGQDKKALDDFYM